MIESMKIQVNDSNFDYILIYHNRTGIVICVIEYTKENV
jgi:hypothetical protein